MVIRMDYQLVNDPDQGQVHRHKGMNIHRQGGFPGANHHTQVSGPGLNHIHSYLEGAGWLKMLVEGLDSQILRGFEGFSGYLQFFEGK